MFQTMSPYFIPLAVFIGGCLAPVIGWARAYQNSVAAQKVAGEQAPPVEQLDWRRVRASAIVAAIAAVIFLGQYASAISVGLPDAELALIAGFGCDKIVKNAIGI